MSILSTIRQRYAAHRAAEKTAATERRRTLREFRDAAADEADDLSPEAVMAAVEADGRGFDAFNAAVNRELERRQIAADDTNRDALAQEYTKLLNGIQELRDSIPATVRRIEDQIRAAEKELSRNELARLRLQRQDTRLRDIEAADVAYFGSEAAR